MAKRSTLDEIQENKLEMWRLAGINIHELSQKNHKQLDDDLLSRKGVPKAEIDRYGEDLFSPEEQSFYDYWQEEIIPKFVSLHGTENLALIKDALIPVADRKREQVNKNTIKINTGGKARQEVLYFVLGIGDKHEVPNFISQWAGLVKLDFNKIPPDQLALFNNMFIGGHISEYLGSRKYCEISAGSTVISVQYDRDEKTKTTTFRREDGEEIVEKLHFNDEIISHDGDFKQIFSWLGKKVILYARYVGGPFQEQLLASRNPEEIAAIFHAWFPSHRFPELKLFVNKLPMDAPFIEVKDYNPEKVRYVYDLFKAVLSLDADGVKDAIRYVEVNALNGSDQTPLEALLTHYKSKNPDVDKILSVVNVLLDHGAKLNGDDSMLAMAFDIDERVFERLLTGSNIPDCKDLKFLPHIHVDVMERLIKASNFELFKRLYPRYKRINNLHNLFSRVMLHIYSGEEKNAEVYVICKMIAEEIDVNLPLPSGKTLLAIACSGDRFRLVKLLINEFGCNVNQGFSVRGDFRFEGCFPAHIACFYHADKSLVVLMAAGADFTKSNVQGETPYALALRKQKELKEKAKKDKLEKFNEYCKKQNIECEPWLEYEKRKKAYKNILYILEKYRANLSKEAEAKPVQKKQAAGALITVTVKENQYVLFVRKAGPNDVPTGNYLFPGGLFDDRHDKNYYDTAVRETKEETGLDLSEVEGKQIYIFTEETSKSHCEIPFFFFDLGERDQLPNCYADSDIGATVWFNVAKLNDQLPIPIEHSNRLLLAPILRGDGSLSEAEIEDINASMLLHSNVKLFKDIGRLYEIATDALHIELRSGGTNEHIINVPDDEIDNVSLDEYLEENNAFLKGINLFSFLNTSSQSVENEIIKAVQEILDKKFDQAADTIINLIVDLVQAGKVPLAAFRVKMMGYCPLDDPPLIFRVSQFGNVDHIEKLIKLGANLEEICLIIPDDDSGTFVEMTALTSFIHFGKNKLAIELIEKSGIDIDGINHGVSVLVSACQQSDVKLEFVRLLMSKMTSLSVHLIGAAINAAVRHHNNEVLNYLLELQPINLNRPYETQTAYAGVKDVLPLMEAIDSINLEAVKLLLKHGASPLYPFNEEALTLDSVIDRKQSSLWGKAEWKDEDGKRVKFKFFDFPPREQYSRKAKFEDLKKIKAMLKYRDLGDLLRQPEDLSESEQLYVRLGS